MNVGCLVFANGVGEDGRQALLLGGGRFKGGLGADVAGGDVVEVAQVDSVRVGGVGILGLDGVVVVGFDLGDYY